MNHKRKSPAPKAVHSTCLLNAEYFGVGINELLSWHASLLGENQSKHSHDLAWLNLIHASFRNTEKPLHAFAQRLSLRCKIAAALVWGDNESRRKTALNQFVSGLADVLRRRNHKNVKASNDQAQRLATEGAAERKGDKQND